MFTDPTFLHGLRDKVVAGEGMNPQSKMSASGVPPHIVLSHQLKEMRGALKQTQDRVEHLVMELPDRLEEKLAANMSINGAIPVTRDQFNESMRNIKDVIRTEFINFMGASNSAVSVQSQSNSINSNEQARLGEWYFWGGRGHPVPEGFIFPRNCGLHTLWNLWYGGDRSRKIAPYRYIRSFDIAGKDRGYLSKAKTVMEDQS
jgi:hypothetical protein